MSNINQSHIPNHLLAEITEALESVKYGSIEIFVQNKIITQIIVRNIHKTSMEIERKEEIKITSNSHSVTSNIQTHEHTQKSSVKIG